MSGAPGSGVAAGAEAPQDNGHRKQPGRKGTGPVSKLSHFCVATLKTSISIFVAENRDSIPLQLPEPIKVSSKRIVLHKSNHVVTRPQIHDLRNVPTQILLSQVMKAIVPIDEDMQLCPSSSRERRSGRTLHCTGDRVKIALAREIEIRSQWPAKRECSQYGAID